MPERRLLLTGATGFVGRNFLLRALNENRYTDIFVPVRNVERLRSQFRGDGYAELPASIRPIHASAPAWELPDLPPIDHVVHAAGVLFSRSRKEFFSIHVDGTLNLLRALSSASRIIVLSSQSAAGPCSAHEAEKTEGEREAPVTWYGESKLEMERRVCEELPRGNFIFLRPPMILGARDQATLPLFQMAQRPLRFKPGFRTKFYSYLSVNDLVTAIFSALEAPGDWSQATQRVYFVAAEAPISDRELISVSGKVSGKNGMLLTLPQPLVWMVSQIVDRIPQLRTAVPSLTKDRAKEIWPSRWVVSSKAFEKKFQWKPTESLTTALRSTFDWYVRTGQLSQRP